MIYDQEGRKFLPDIILLHRKQNDKSKRRNKMENINTELGKIYSKYNEKEDKFDMYRVASIVNTEEFKYLLLPIDDKTYHFYNDETECKIMDEEDYKKFKSEYDLLKSDGIVSLSNIVSVKNESREIKDVLLIYFPNNKVSQVPDINEPYVIARQGINNIFAEMSGQLDTVGLSVSLDTLPAGYALSDFIANEEVDNSVLAHVYKTDDNYDIDMLLDNKDTDKIFKELFNQRVFYLSNIKPDFKEDDYKDEDKSFCLDGYCNNLYRFLCESGFVEDIKNHMGITLVDFDMEENKPLDIEDKLVLISLYGGIKIDKAVPLMFSYEINLKSIKMKYLLVSTIKGIDTLDERSELYIIPYTEYPDEVDIYSLYKLTEERTIQLQERLMKCVKAYDIKSI